MIELISLAFGLLVFSGVYIILYRIGMEKDEIAKRIQGISKIENRDFVPDEEMNKPISQRLIKPLLVSMGEGIRKRLPQGEGTIGESEKSEKLKKKLRQAGIRMRVSEYKAVQLLVIIGSAMLLAVLSFLFTFRMQGIPFAALIGAYGVYVVMRFDLARKIAKRSESMQIQLPEVLDMLSVSVEAGLGLEQAILHVNNHFNGPLIDELSVTYREMTMGRSRRDALLSLGERCQIEDVNSFVRAIVQAGELGISIKNVLRSQSAFIRQSRRNKVEEKAMQVSVKILLPMAFFIFPVIFIVLMGPAAVTIYTQFIK
ncbi:MAG: type II secretion system F family protein [Methanosarcina sp.]|nr:type II secretion system F family protein [Methanosarcina sp.]